MALWSSAPKLMRQLQKRMSQGEGREEAALGVLGFTLEELNLKLGEAWHLPALAQESQCLCNSYRPQPLIVMMGVALARISVHHWDSQETQDKLELLAEFLEIPLNQAESQFHHLAAAAAGELRHLPLPLPDYNLLPVSAESFRPAEKPLQSCPAPDESDREAMDSRPEKTAQASAAPPPKPLHPSPPRSPVLEKLTHFLHEMKTHHGLQRVMFATLSNDQQQLKARLVLENRKQATLNDFQIDLQKPSLFVALLKRPQALWVNAAKQKKYRPMIPSAVHQAICDEGFLLMSIFIKHRPIGLLYADSGCGDEALTAGQYENFKTLCQQLMKDLG